MQRYEKKHGNNKIIENICLSNILFIFLQKTIFLVMIDIDEILSNEDITAKITALKERSTKPHFWSSLRKDYEPSQHKIVTDRQGRRDKIHSDGSKDCAARISIGLERLLAKRMKVSRNIGEYKKEVGMTVVQTRRYSEILDKRGAQGSLLGIGRDCIKSIFENIHEESVRQQMEIFNK